MKSFNGCWPIGKLVLHASMFIQLLFIGIADTLVLLQVLEPSFRDPYVNVNRWFTTCVNQPQFKTVLGDVQLCTKMATFDGKMYPGLLITVCHRTNSPPVLSTMTFVRAKMNSEPMGQKFH